MANLVVTNNANTAFFHIALNDMRGIKTEHNVVSLRKSEILLVQNHIAETVGGINIPAYLEVILRDGTVYPLEVTAEYVARYLTDPTAIPVGMLIDSVCGVACTDSTQTRNLILANL